MPYRAMLFALTLLVTCAALERARPAVAQTQPAKESALIKVEIKVSKTLSLFYFAQAVARQPSRSQYLRDLYDGHRGEVDVEEEMREALDSVAGGVQFYGNRSDLPDGRHNGQNVIDILEAVALQSASLQDFGERSRALMPVVEHARMMRALAALEPIHEAHVWVPGKRFLGKTHRALEAASKRYKMEATLQRIATFYGTQWPGSEPITIGLVPVPGLRKRSISNAHSLGSFEVVEVLEEDDIGSRFGVIIHELCHSFYQAQPLPVQLAQHARFHASKTLAGHLASQEINEAVATVLGNGWVEADIMGRPVLESSWYNDPVIDPFAKAIYPDIKAYLEAGKTWDSALTDTMIERFRQAFPDAHRSPLFVFQRVALIVDADEGFADERAPLARVFRRAGNTAYSRPAKHPFSLDSYKETGSFTALFLLGQDHVKGLKQFPFYAKHHKALEEGLATKKAFFYATRETKNQRMHIFISPGKHSSMLPIYEHLAGLDALPMGEVTPLP